MHIIHIFYNTLNLNIYALIFRLIYSSPNVFQYISTVKMLEIDARRCSIKKLSWKIWENSQGNTCEGKTLLADLACNFSKKCLQHRCFPMILQNFPEQPFCRTLTNGIKASARYHFAIKWSFFVITKKLVIIISTVNVLIWSFSKEIFNGKL